MRKNLIILTIAMTLAAIACHPTQPTYKNYQEAVTNWTSYKDVANWLNYKFRYSEQRRRKAMNGAVVRKPERLYDMKEGFCVDAAYFAKDALNTINPEYEAKLIHIQNKKGPPHHTVTGFKVNGELYVMDYGTGMGWTAMQGTHGPYRSLDDYHRFLSRLSIPTFSVAYVGWDDGFRLSED